MPQSYTPVFKKKIVRLRLEDGRTYKSITSEYGVSKVSIFTEKTGVRKQIRNIYHSHNGVDGYRSMTTYVKRAGHRLPHTIPGANSSIKRGGNNPINFSHKCYKKA